MSRRRDDRGSITVWTLGMVLVVMFLSAITLDLWSGFSTRRQYAAAVDQAAQAGANGLDEALFRATGQRQLDPSRSEALAHDSLAASDLPGMSDVQINASTTEIVIEVSGSVDVGLLRIFGDGRPLTIRVQAIGRPEGT